jgi:Tol biopolymer transport system component
VRQITQGKGSCEYPSWSPSGRHLTFACGRVAQVADRHRGPRRPLRHHAAGRTGKNEQPDWGPAPQ